MRRRVHRGELRASDLREDRLALLAMRLAYLQFWD